MDYSSNKFIIAVHFVLYGAADALEDFLVGKKSLEVMSVRVPFHFQRNFIITKFRKGKKVKQIKKKRPFSLGVFDYILDFLSVIFIVLIQDQKYEYFIGVNNLNALAGLFLKKIGRVEKVIFYGIDFVPVRFKNNLLNRIYHLVERYCVMHCDEVWNVSPRMEVGRDKLLGINQKNFPQKVVEIGVWNKNIVKKPFSKIKKNRALFVGALLEKQGVQKVLEAIPLIVRKIPDFKFDIVGWGEYEDQLKEIVNKLKINDYVKFIGLVSNRKKLEEIMSSSSCAIATYAPLKDGYYNFTYYADPTKLKDYLSTGLPIIMTKLPHNAKFIESKECGLIVEYNKESIADGIVELLTDQKRLIRFRHNALEISKNYDWDTIFSKAFK